LCKINGPVDWGQLQEPKYHWDVQSSPVLWTMCARLERKGTVEACESVFPCGVSKWKGKCIFGRFPKPLRSIPRGGLLLVFLCDLNFGSVMLCCGFVEKFDDLEMVG